MRYNVIKIVAMESVKDTREEGEVCTCDLGHEDHTCPYSEEINHDSESLCNCCSYCAQQCADDI